MKYPVLTNYLYCVMVSDQFWSIAELVERI